MANLLIELGCEELPAGSMMALASHLGTGVHKVLSDAGLADAAPEIFATPRRLAVRLSNVGERQADKEVERRGPSVAAAYKDGEPTKALQGFMRSAGVSIDDLQTISTPKGDWLTVKQTQQGETLESLLQSSLPEIIKTMPMPKRMRWGDQAHEFLRPVVWLLALHGSATLKLELLGLSASNTSLGHRFHAPEPIVVTEASAYEDLLEQAHVLADARKRREKIVAGVKQEAARLGGDPVMDEELVDEVNALVEWPVAMAGTFDAEFLEIPKEALIQTMQENQRYFALLDGKGELMPAFITVANLESVSPQTVVDGNERVIRPRFADTMFFWNQDKQRTLESHRGDLDRLLFQEKLGSVSDKCTRMQGVSSWLATAFGANEADASLAASLCKCDLNTEIVKELAKMQGIAGRYYALRDGHGKDVCVAMEEHYYPKQSGGALPGNTTASIVSIADKIDTLVGIFGIGMKPTGAKDPFALRRASLGILRILIEQQHDISLSALVDKSIDTYGEVLASAKPDELRSEVLAYMLERLRGYFTADRGFAAEAVEAVLAKRLSHPLDMQMRLDAIESFRKTEESAALAAASKRIGNLLKKVDTSVPENVNEALLSDSAEQALFAVLDKQSGLVNDHLASRDYASAMKVTSSLRDAVDSFFEGVMVMDKDEAVRDNRLALIKQVNELCCATADISRLQGQDKT